MRLIQLLGDGVEELWEFEDDIGDGDIEGYYKEYLDYEASESFEDFMELFHPEVECGRKFVDEIYI